MLPRVLRIAGYVGAFIFFLLLFIRMTFPTEALGNMLKVRIADGTGATDVKLDGVSLLGLIPSGVELRGLEITFPDVAVKAEAPNTDRFLGRFIQADVLSVNASLGGLSKGEIDARFSGTIMGGEIEGGRVLFPLEGMAEIHVDAIRGVALGGERLFADLTGFDIRGVLSGHVDLRFPVSNNEGRRVPELSGLEGSIELTIDDAIVKDPIVEHMQMRQPLTDARLGSVKLSAKAGSPAKAGDSARPRASMTSIRLEELSATGPDVMVGLAPRASLVIPAGRPLSQATIRAHLAIRLDPEFINRSIDDPNNPGTQTQPNKLIQTLVLDGLARKGHVQDGDIGLGIRGNLARPNIGTERPQTRIGATGTAGRRMNVNTGDDGDEDEDEDEDDFGEAPPPAVAPPAAAGRPGRRGAMGGPVNRPAMGGNARPLTTSPVGARAVNRPRGMDRRMPGLPPEAYDPSGAAEEHDPED